MSGADRMKTVRDRRRDRGLRELRLVIPDPSARPVRQRIAIQVAKLNRSEEHDALAWIEAISEFEERSA